MRERKAREKMRKRGDGSDWGTHSKKERRRA